MHYIYLLKSQKDGRIYIGQTNDLIRRYAEHNSGRAKATRPFAPWKLVYYEAFLNKKDALIREAKLKQNGRSRVWLKKRLQNSLT